MPVIVRDLDDDAATIIMVDSNLQRESLLPVSYTHLDMALYLISGENTRLPSMTKGRERQFPAFS